MIYKTNFLLPQCSYHSGIKEKKSSADWILAVYVKVFPQSKQLRKLWPEIRSVRQQQSRSFHWGCSNNSRRLQETMTHWEGWARFRGISLLCLRQFTPSLHCTEENLSAGHEKLFYRLVFLKKNKAENETDSASCRVLPFLTEWMG